jgi:hypothetical protein
MKEAERKESIRKLKTEKELFITTLDFNNMSSTEVALDWPPFRDLVVTVLYFIMILFS